MILNGLGEILETIGMRYEIDAKGRLTREMNGGVLPRFVLGRAVEGCIWRFSIELEPDRLNAVSRLAGRESGMNPSAGGKPSPPERLVMIERILVPESAERETRYEMLTRNGVDVAEIWSVV